MKIIPITYTFDASAKTIDCADFTRIEIIYLITNVKTWDIIYQFNNASKGGTLAGTVLTLVFDTTSMSDTDELQIVLQDPVKWSDIQGAINSVDLNLTSNILPELVEIKNSNLDIGWLFNAIVKQEDESHASWDQWIMLLWMRSDNDSSTANDGDYTILKLDEQWRLKVSSKPASYPDITGDITAVQATIGTPVAWGTVEGDVSRASNLMIFCTGTFSTVNCTFEWSLEASWATNWFAVQAVRSNANIIELTTGNLSAQPAYAWEASVNALKRFRVRCTARTSGTQSWRFVQGTYATEPIPASQVSGTQPVSGTVTASVTPPAPTTPYFLNSAASTNWALIITGTSGVASFYATNEWASTAYIKLYNKATAPTVWTDIPEMIIPVPAASWWVPWVANPNIWFIGFRFALGLGIAITRNAVHTDTTAIWAQEVKVKLSRTT